MPVETTTTATEAITSGTSKAVTVPSAVPSLAKSTDIVADNKLHTSPLRKCAANGATKCTHRWHVASR